MPEAAPDTNAVRPSTSTVFLLMASPLLVALPLVS
jgi:hypothetical protein